MAPGVLVLDEAKAEDDAALHLAWRQWLQLFNTAQSLPGMWLVTASGLDQHDYDGLNPLPASTAAKPSECCRRPKTDSLKGLMPIQN